MSLKIVEIVDNCKVYNDMFIRFKDNGRNEYMIQIVPHNSTYRIIHARKLYTRCNRCGSEMIILQKDARYEVTGSPFVRNILRGTGKWTILICDECNIIQQVDPNLEPGSVVSNRAFGALLQWN